MEYKSSFRWDIRKKQVNKSLQKEVVRAIQAFLNTEGGILLIGVMDDGYIYGIENDIRTLGSKDKDGFEQALIQVISNYLGTEYCKYINIRFEEKAGKIICIARIEPSPRPVFLKDKFGKEFYIRAGNTSRPLDVEETHEYIGMHWEV
ncbi:MAG: helix-turn-helix domain-containing protein [Methanosarcinales archaeon]